MYRFKKIIPASVCLLSGVPALSIMSACQNSSIIENAVSLSASPFQEADHNCEATYSFHFDDRCRLPDDGKVYVHIYEKGTTTEHHEIESTSMFYDINSDRSINVSVKFKHDCIKNEREEFQIIFWYWFNDEFAYTLVPNILTVAYTAPTTHLFDIGVTDQIIIPEDQNETGYIWIKCNDSTQTLLDNKVYVSITEEDGGNEVSIDNLEAGKEKEIIWDDLESMLFLDGINMRNPQQMDTANIKITFRYKKNGEDHWNYSKTRNIVVLPCLHFTSGYIDSAAKKMKMPTKRESRDELVYILLFAYDYSWPKECTPDHVDVEIQGNPYVTTEQDSSTWTDESPSVGQQYKSLVVWFPDNADLQKTDFYFNIIFTYEIDGIEYKEGMLVTYTLPDYIYAEKETTLVASANDTFDWTFKWNNQFVFPEGDVKFEIVSNDSESLVVFDNDTTVTTCEILDQTNKTLNFKVNDSLILQDPFDVTLNATYKVQGEPERVQPFDISFHPFDDNGFINVSTPKIKVNDLTGNATLSLEWVSERKPDDKQVTLTIPNLQISQYLEFDDEAASEDGKTFVWDLSGDDLKLDIKLKYDKPTHEEIKPSDIVIKSNFKITNKQREHDVNFTINPRTIYITSFDDYIPYTVNHYSTESDRPIGHVYFDWTGEIPVDNQMTVSVIDSNGETPKIKFWDNETSSIVETLTYKNITKSLQYFDVIYMGDEKFDSLEQYPQINFILEFKFKIEDPKSNEPVEITRYCKTKIQPANHDFLHLGTYTIDQIECYPFYIPISWQRHLEPLFNAERNAYIYWDDEDYEAGGEYGNAIVNFYQLQWKDFNCEPLNASYRMEEDDIEEGLYHIQYNVSITMHYCFEGYSEMKQKISIDFIASMRD